MNSTQNPLPAMDAFHRERSVCIDAFAMAEEAIVRLLATLGDNRNGDLLGQKIERLRTAKASPKYSKARKAEVLSVLDRLAPLLEIRNDLVHAPMRIVLIDDKPVAVFANPRHTGQAWRMAHLLTPAGMREVTQQVITMAETLRGPINPASSPPPPLRAAGGGP